MRWRSIGPDSRRPFDCGGRQRRAPERVLLRRRRRRRVEDDRLRHDVGCGRRHRLPHLVGRRDRDRARRIPTSSTPAWASRASAATSSRATASTRRRDAGKTLDARRARRHRSRQQDPRASRPIRTSCTPRCSAIRTTRTRSRGVYRSKDGGKTWEKVLFRDDRSGAIDLSMDPKNPDVLYAATWQVYRTPWSMESGGPGSALYKSTDGGTTWTDITKNPGLPAGPLGQGRRVGLRRRQQSRLRDHRERQRRRVRLRRCGRDVAQDQRGSQPAPARVLLHAHLRRSRWRRTRSTSSTCSSSSPPTAARRSRRRFACRTATTTTCGSRPTTTSGWSQANDGGGNVSVNGGQTWSGQDYPTGQFYNVFTTRHVPYHVCGAQQDNSTACVGSQNNPGAGEGSLPPIFYAVGGGESGYIAPDPKDTDVFFAGSYGGYLSRLDRDTGQQRAINIYPNNPMGWSSVDIKERFQWTFPIVFSPTDPERPLRVVATPVAHDQRRPELGEDQPEPDAVRSEDDAGVGRADHQGPDRRRNLRRDLHGRAVAPGRQHDLDRLGRRLGARDARRRQELGAR